MTIKIGKYNYQLPEELIAQTPMNPRDNSRLLVFDTIADKSFNRKFFEIINFLNPNDLLVVNNSKVLPARLIGKKETGGKIEILLLEEIVGSWKVLTRGKVAIGEKIIFDKDFFAEIIKKDGKEATVAFNLFDDNFWRKIQQFGKMPIPPYIKKNNLSESVLRKEYQTIYAREFGSAAAPTAGLHFTKQLVGSLKLAGTKFVSVDLHVGLGTFMPLEPKNIKEKKLHSENFSIPHSTTEKILLTKRLGGRVIAVGTTTVRALESSAEDILANKKDISGSTDTFIQPGDNFKIIDGLITNFHIPKSSLMMLVAALLQYKGLIDGRIKLLELYQFAIENKYRFYSFGDAMLII